ncbi:hypothetical protein [Rhizobium sp. 3T7]|uniref:hypothetical protein n=1 Tax=Rhizobium sp. 3T7 TaxID=2874922 RepID=UPI00398D35D0
MGKAHFSDDFKRDAVLQITERGYPISEVSAAGVSCEWKKKFTASNAKGNDEVSVIVHGDPEGAERVRLDWRIVWSPRDPSRGSTSRFPVKWGNPVMSTRSGVDDLQAPLRHPGRLPATKLLASKPAKFCGTLMRAS